MTRKPVALWPAAAPGETTALPPERDTTKPSDRPVAGRPVIRLGNVSQPTLTVYQAPHQNPSGAAVVVFPGGGYSILAMDLEGTEICEWLNSIGVTAVLVKYRVPKRPGVERYAPPLQDAQRAMSLVRERAPEFGINPTNVGVIGFSAGAHLCATLAASVERTYPRIDAADDLSWKPNFTMLIYPAYLMQKDKPEETAQEVSVSTNTPATFMVMSEDDPIGVDNVLRYGLALKKAKVPFELHVYPKGGHGYGLRRTDNPLTRWPKRAAQWMRSQGITR